jgi:soluble epoxide hydrolase / lipid-phosphate phosphatase
VLFRKGTPGLARTPAVTANIRARGGWFPGMAGAPDLPMDEDVVTEADLRIYADGLKRNGFFGPNSYYMNHPANSAYAARRPNGGRIDMPVLFLAARYDYVCLCTDSRLADPMRELCDDLTYVTIDSGHWMAQEKPREVNAAIAGWLAGLSDVWLISPDPQ